MERQAPEQESAKQQPDLTVPDNTITLSLPVAIGVVILIISILLTIFDQRRCKIKHQTVSQRCPQGSLLTSTRCAENRSTNEEAGSWTQAMEQRLCLLVYGPGNDTVFENDCKKMKEVLTIRATSEDNIKLMTLTEFNDSHLEYIMKSESAMFEKLRKQKFANLPKDMFKIMIYGVYSGIRLLKARDNFKSALEYKQIFCEHSKAYISTYIQHITNFAFDRWTYWTHYTIACKCNESDKSKLLRVFMKLKQQVSTSNANARNKSDSEDNAQKTEMRPSQECTPSEFVEEQEERINKWEAEWIESKKGVAGTDIEKGTARKHVRKMFSMSVYSSGFLPYSYFDGKQTMRVSGNHTILRKWFTDHLKPTSVVHYGVKVNSDKTTELDSKQDSTDDKSHSAFESLLKCLPQCVALSNQWLWLHYSGHNVESVNSELPSRELELFFKLSRDLFSNVVLSLDCCFPDAPRRVSDTHVIALLACASDMRALYPEGGKFSHFTKDLIHALKGFPPNDCLYSRGGETNACSTCIKLNKDVMAAKGLISSQKVREFFEGHRSTCKVRCDSEYHFPLRSVRDTRR